MTIFFRQGDVLLEKIEFSYDSLGGLITKVDTKIIAYGEKTGHSHFFDSNDNNNPVLLYKEINKQDPSMAIIKSNTAILKHQDHLHIRIPCGIYKIKRERSFNPFTSQKQKQIYESYD